MEYDRDVAARWGRWLIIEMESHFKAAERGGLPFDTAAIAAAYVGYGAQLGILAGDVLPAAMAAHLREVADKVEVDAVLPMLAWLEC